MEELEIDQEGEELIRVLCSYLAEALEDALDEIDENEDWQDDVEPLDVAKKHISKRLDYMVDEGWIDDAEIN